MKPEHKKNLRKILVDVAFFGVVLLLLNLFLTRRLERYLKKELVERTTKATDGFYHLSFDDLSVSFFKGELKIKGARLWPDSTLLRQWKAIDSLPPIFVRTHVGSIDFTGVNLTWRWDFKHLNFTSFDVKSPHVEVVGTYYSGKAQQMTRHTRSRTLYEIISPYINMLSVNTLNLDDATVSYIVGDPETPIVYALQDVSFHGYGFRLDSASSRSGKLLYCDQFDFITHQSQTLLTNNDFLLTTDSIRMSTLDSTIFIRNIHLIPQEKLWRQIGKKPSTYLNAQIDTVRVEGVHLKRENALNNLTARSFGIASSDVHVYKLDPQKSRTEHADAKKNSSMPVDSLVQSLSLYEIISPLLHKVAIQQIDIDKTRLAYTVAVQQTLEQYELDNFDFRATGFLIDSASSSRSDLEYLQNFAFTARQIRGHMTAHNHIFTIGRMQLDTQQGRFCIENMHLNPISTDTPKDYISGSIDTIRINQLVYNKGVRAGLLWIDKPRMDYFSMSAASAVSEKQNGQQSMEAIFNPFLRYFLLQQMRITDADIAYHDKKRGDTVVYALKNFNFQASGLRMDPNTCRQPGLFFFRWHHFGFRFEDLDSNLPGVPYRLRVQQGAFSTHTGRLKLQNIQLRPWNVLGLSKSDTYVDLTIPLINAAGIGYIPDDPIDHRMTIDLGCITVQGPSASVFQKQRLRTDPSVSAQNNRTLYQQLSPYVRRIALQQLDVKDAKISYTLWLDNQKATDGQLDSVRLLLNGLEVDNEACRTRLDTIRLTAQHVVLPVASGFYTLKIGCVDLDNDRLVLDSVHLKSLYPKMEFAYRQPQHKDWFDVRAGRLQLTGMNLPDYVQTRVLRVEDVGIQNVLLQNFKNKQIEIQPHWMPMIYAGLQKAPFKIDIPRIHVADFSVVYEELAPKGTKPGKLFLTGLGGTFSDFTNIVSRPDQYITLDATGRLMDKGTFKATWKIPVDSLNDRFLLHARVAPFDLTVLNQIITPLASAKVASGFADGVTFDMDASSQGGNIRLLFLYRDLKAELLKEKDGVEKNKKFLSGLVNFILKDNNPDHPDRKDSAPRTVDIYVKRDPYHSTFNYLWQMLRPAIIQSVGVSQKEQKVVKGAANVFSKVKNFFGIGKKKKKDKKE